MFRILRRNPMIYMQNSGVQIRSVKRRDLSNKIASTYYKIFPIFTGFPIALSYPHFYKSDPSLLEDIEGLEPKKELHESYFYIQPKSGIPLAVASRFQINIALQNVGHMANVEKFTDLTIPLLWFEIVSTAIDVKIDMNVPLKLSSKRPDKGVISSYS